MPCTFKCFSFFYVGHILLQAKELLEVEQALLEATCAGSEPGTSASVGPPQPVPQHSSQQELQQSRCTQSFGFEQNQHHVRSPGFGSGGNQHMAHEPDIRTQPAPNAAPNRSWAAQRPVPASSGPSWPPSNIAAAAVAPPTQQPTTFQPISAAYTVEEPDSPVGSGLDTENKTVSPTPGSILCTEELPAKESWHAAPPHGVQGNATHVLMRKVECKRTSNGKPTAPKLRVREVYARIDPNGQRQTVAAERKVLQAPTAVLCFLHTGTYMHTRNSTKHWDQS